MAMELPPNLAGGRRGTVPDQLIIIQHLAPQYLVLSSYRKCRMRWGGAGSTLGTGSFTRTAHDGSRASPTAFPLAAGEQGVRVHGRQAACHTRGRQLRVAAGARVVPSRDRGEADEEARVVARHPHGGRLRRLAGGLRRWAGRLARVQSLGFRDQDRGLRPPRLRRSLSRVRLWARLLDEVGPLAATALELRRVGAHERHAEDPHGPVVLVRHTQLHEDHRAVLLRRRGRTAIAGVDGGVANRLALRKQRHARARVRQPCVPPPRCGGGDRRRRALGAYHSTAQAAAQAAAAEVGGRKEGGWGVQGVLPQLLGARDVHVRREHEVLVAALRPQPQGQIGQLVHIGAVLGHRLAQPLEQLRHELARSGKQ
eukprot:scaffold2368_cov72-Phaeocystis_antarctica.AAC.4